MSEKVVSNPEYAQMDPMSAETIRRSQLVKFAPTEFYRQGRPKSAGEFHVAVLCRQPGDVLTFSLTTQEAGGNQNFMDLGTGGVGAVWVVTESGNRYGIGNGYVYNHKEGKVYALDKNASTLQLRVGSGAFLPGAGTTSEIKSILVNDEINYGDDQYSWTEKDAGQVPVVNAIDPLLHVRAIGDAINMYGDGSGAVQHLQGELAEIPSKASFV